MVTIYDLPFEILEMIAKGSMESCRSLLAFPTFGRVMLNLNTRMNYISHFFTISIVGGPFWFIEWKTQNGKFSSPWSEIPALESPYIKNWMRNGKPFRNSKRMDENFTEQFTTLRGTVIKTWSVWDSNRGRSILHRDEDFPTKKEVFANVYMKLYWFKNDLQHRDFGLPSCIIFDSKGKIIELKWKKNGTYYKRGSDLPSVVLK